MLVLRSALRGLRHAPGFTTITVAVLGLGLGANIILFNALNALLWRPLPFPDAGRLVSLEHRGAEGAHFTVSSGRDAADLRQRVPSLSAVGLSSKTGPLAFVLGSQGTVDFESASVNSGYLAALGQKPVAGRFFREEEDFGRAGEDRAVLAESAWRQYFDSDPGLVGRTIAFLDGGNPRPIRIVGIYPDRVTLPYLDHAVLLTPIAWRHADLEANRGNLLYRTVLRVKPGVEVSQASAQASAALSASEMELPESQRGRRSALIPLRSALVAQRTPAWLLYSAAGLLLLLTTINVASLFLARALARRHETAVRRALGASFGHTLREQLVEALLVCGAGLGLALALNEWGQSLVPVFVPELRNVGPELLSTGSTLVAFGVVTSLVVACALTLLPVLQSRRLALLPALSGSGRATSVRAGWQGRLASAQLAVILVLLALGGLIGRSFVEALRTPPGFDAAHAITLRASIPGPAEARTGGAYELARVIAAVPGTSGVGFAAERPIGLTYSASHSTRPGEFTATDPSVPFRLVDGGYFRALGTRLVSGRVMTEAEVRGQADVAVLNQSAARLLFGAIDPVGRQVHSALGNTMLRVVGVVEDMRSEGLDRNAPPMLYRGYHPFFGSDVFFTVRTARNPDDYAAAVQARVKDWNARVVLRDIVPMEARLRETVAGRMRASALVGGFALLGLLVGTVGLYGTVAAYAQQLRRELGIRLALGAPTGSVLRRVLGHGLRLVAAGTVVGVAASAAAAVFIRKQLYGILPWDLPAFAAALVLLVAAALSASLVPALRASRINPAEVLRGQ